MGRSLRWIIYAPVAILALFGSSVSAQSFITWTCWAETQWQMYQPQEDYNAGLMPNWSDCERWRNGTPEDPTLWSYGQSVAVSTTTTEITTTTEQTTTTTTTSTSTTTTEPATTTTSTTSTTVPLPPPPAPEPATTTTEETTTTSSSTTTIVATTTTFPQTTTSVEPTTTVVATSVVETTVPETVVEESPAPTYLAPELLEETPSNDAPEEVKEAFEEQVNIFNGQHDDYIPLGSKISVGQRRTIVAVTTVLVLLPTPVSRRKL